MNLNIKSASILFIVFLVVSLTPAFAVQMEQVANDAKKYDTESKEKKSFFAKIKFMVKGFKLIKKAKSAEKESNENNQDSDGDIYETMWNRNQVSKKTTQDLLQFRNLEKTTTNPLNTSNDTNNTNITKKNVTNTFNRIPAACFTDADILIKLLAKKKVTLTKTTQTEINDQLVGNIVQIIDEKGHIRYLYMKNLTGTDIALVTTDNKEITLTTDEFKKGYTGIILQIKQGNPESIITQINQIQKNQIATDTSNAEKNKAKAKNNMIIGGIVAGVGLVLVVVGVLLAIIFGKSLVSSAQSVVTSFNGVEPGLQLSLITNLQKAGISIYPGLASSIVASAIAPLITISVALGVEAAIWIIAHSVSQNWIKLILTVIGAILIIVGFGSVVYGIYLIISNYLNYDTSKESIDRLKKESEDMDEWLKRGDLINGTEISTNSTINSTIMNSTPFNKTNKGFLVAGT
jgi:hypothetical protein